MVETTYDKLINLAWKKYPGNDDYKKQREAMFFAYKLVKLKLSKEEILQNIWNKYPDDEDLRTISYDTALKLNK